MNAQPARDSILVHGSGISARWWHQWQQSTAVAAVSGSSARQWHQAVAQDSGISAQQWEQWRSGACHTADLGTLLSCPICSMAACTGEGLTERSALAAAAAISAFRAATAARSFSVIFDAD